MGDQNRTSPALKDRVYYCTECRTYLGYVEDFEEPLKECPVCKYKKWDFALEKSEVEPDDDPLES